MNQWKRAGAVLTAMTIFIGTTGSALALEDFEAEPAPQQEELSVQQTQTITGFVQAQTELMQLSFYAGQPEEELTAAMPSVLTAYVDGIEQEIPVTWYCMGDYSTSDDFYYQYCPQWDTQAYTLADGLNAWTDVPYVSIVRTAESAAAQDGTMQAQYNAGTVQTIFNFLRKELNLNSAAASGVLANVEAESDFQPSLWGDNHTSYGILQWHNDRLTAMQNWCAQNGYDWKTLNGQLWYLKKELSANDGAYLFNGKTIRSKLQGVQNSAQGAYDAGYYWCYEYERPANKDTKSISRGNKAVTEYWAKYKSGNIVAVPGGDASVVKPVTSQKPSGNTQQTEKNGSDTAVEVFSDVTASSWFAGAADFVYQNKLMVGTSASKFSPNDKLNRAMGATILQRMSKMGNGAFTIKTGTPIAFKDVANGSWYAAGVNWATAGGIMKGMSSTSFAPMDNMTREQMVYVMYGYCAKLGCNVSASASLKNFSDAGSISNYARKAVQWAVSENILKGSSGKLNPKGSITRAEAAALYQRFYNYVKN